ncbi:MAG: uroporphyrinogen decarboxylase family protein [bacterium]
MTGYERIAAVIAGKKPDTTPVMLHNFMMAAREAGISMATFRSNPHELARAFIEAIEKYEYDGIMIDVDTVTLAGAVGVPIDFPEDEPARVCGARISSLEEVDGLLPVDIRTYCGVEVWLEATRIVKNYFDDQIYIRGNCDQSPFTLASLMRGISPWMMDLADPENAERVHALLNYTTEVTKQFIRLMAETGAHMTSNGDSVAGPELISPEMYREYALPYEKTIVECSHQLGLPYVIHICGDTTTILDAMIETGAEGLELDYRTDAVCARTKMQGKSVFIGNIDPSGVLALGTPQLVEQKTRELLELFDGNAGFILNAGCAIPPTTPPENLRAMIHIARSF